jgi:IS5 family transposase
VKAHPKANGTDMKQGTIIDPTLIAAASFTKKEKGERDPEMLQTRKGKQLHLRRKDHIGVDKDSGLIQSLESTAANVLDLSPAGKLLRAAKKVVYADAGC